ncbi:metallophosphoesterase [Phnomibacter sp. MR]|uniref:metallophosphoesterase n=1 Tax=Phnomibacter sp. MR TaxID=3042318 RepID=UPI003A8086F0
MKYDVFGDIHGYAQELEMLLQQRGYERQKGVYAHPEGRQAIFVGDYIDRGPMIRETLHLIKDMCDAGNALAVMGNHEFNAISFHTPHTESGGFFRDHSLTEIEQHIETLRQFKHFEKEWTYFLEWFNTLPLFLDLEHIRVVHACWDSKHIEWLKDNYTGIDKEILRMANDKRNRSEVFSIINETLKGKEYTLPKGHFFVDKGGVVRNESRIKWWAPKAAPIAFNHYLMDCPPELANEMVPVDAELFTYDDNVPVFFGHYWLKGLPKIDTNAICLDYSVAKNGHLVCCSVDRINNKPVMQLSYQKALQSS